LAVELAGEVALQAALDLSGGLTFSGSAVRVCASRVVVFETREDDRVQRSVELTVAAAVEAVADCLP
jgi:hypothetical protein